MVVPTESFTEIGDADIDPDSPITTGLMTSYRDNDLNLNSQLIGETTPFTAAQKHDHDGLNSALVNAGAGLNFSLFDLSLAGAGTQTASTGALGFTPRAMWVLHSGDYGSGDFGWGAGFAIGTGTLARGITADLDSIAAGTARWAVDSDAVGGLVLVSDGTAFFNDIDVTVFTSANITLSVGGGPVKAIQVKLLVLG